MTAGCGLTSQTPFAYFDRDSSSLRTCAATFLSDSEKSSPTLPASGSMRNGWLYERPMSVRATSASGSSGLLPTPRVAATRTGKSAIVRSSSAPSLDQAIELAMGKTPRELAGIKPPKSWLPTPTARDSKGSDAPGRQGGASLPQLLTVMRSADTKPRSADQSPQQLMIEGG